MRIRVTTYLSTGSVRLRRAFLPVVFLFLSILPRTAAAQIDPEPRANLELGFEGPLRGNGPVSGYGFFLWNRPHFLDKDLYLRAVVSPYIFLEAIRDNWPGKGQAVGVNIGGGFFVNDFDQIQNGVYSRSESFRGDGTAASVSYYVHPFEIAGLLPVDGQIRLGTEYALYQRTSDTNPAYALPSDTFIHSARAGIRFGGVPPELVRNKALEFSLWHEAHYRVKAGTHGPPGGLRSTDHLTQQSWGILNGTMPLWLDHTVSVSMTAGTAGNTDELTCFRLGSGLPFRDEFPFILHGYYPHEVFARSFFLINASYRLNPVPDFDKIMLQFDWDYALVNYLPDHELGRHSLNGLGVDVIFKLTRKLTFSLGYGYGLDAPRHGGYGGQEINLLIEWKL